MDGMRHARKAALNALVLAAFVAPAHAGDAAAGEAKAAPCAACHGKDGNSMNPLWPKLAGQHAFYLAKQLRAFRDGERTDPTMNTLSKPLSDEDIEDLAAYYASLTPR